MGEAVCSRYQTSKCTSVFWFVTDVADEARRRRRSRRAWRRLAEGSFVDVVVGGVVVSVESKGLEKWFVTRSVIQLRRSPPSSMLDKNRESKQLKSRQRRKEKYTYTSIDKLRLERQQHSKPKCNIIYTKIQLTAL